MSNLQALCRPCNSSKRDRNRPFALAFILAAAWIELEEARAAANQADGPRAAILCEMAAESRRDAGVFAAKLGLISRGRTRTAPIGPTGRTWSWRHSLRCPGSVCEEVGQRHVRRAPRWRMVRGDAPPFHGGCVTLRGSGRGASADGVRVALAAAPHEFAARHKTPRGRPTQLGAAPSSAPVSARPQR